jgi:hypothetical protein
MRLGAVRGNRAMLSEPAPSVCFIRAGILGGACGKHWDRVNGRVDDFRRLLCGHLAVNLGSKSVGQ